MAQELLSTFTEYLHSVSLTPSQDNGRYTIRFNDVQILFDRKTEGRFPEIKELKRLVRNSVNPDKPSGHLDRSLRDSPGFAAFLSRFFTLFLLKNI